MKWFGKGDRNFLWTLVFRQVLKDLPGVDICSLDIPSIFCGTIAGTAQDLVKDHSGDEELTGAWFLLAPLLTPVPNVGTREVVLYRTVGEEIWNLSFRIQGDDIVLGQDWRRYN